VVGSEDIRIAEVLETVSVVSLSKPSVRMGAGVCGGAAANAAEEPASQTAQATIAILPTIRTQ
jgi:hypothetical protein